MPLFLTGIGIVVTQGIIALLSQQFVFGQGHVERPILSFLLLEGLAFGLYWIASEWVRRLRGKKAHRLALPWIFIVAVVCRLIFLPSNMIQEVDAYRYLWDGQLLLSGANPYAQAPQDAFEGISWGGAQTHAVRQVYEKISFKEISTVYPPLAQWLFAASQWMSPWQTSGWKAMVIVADLLICLLLLLSFRRLGIAQEWVLLYAWSPLVLKEFLNSLHVDVFALLFLAGMLHLLATNRNLLAYVALGLATMTKLFPVILLPVLVCWTWKRSPRETLLGMGLYASCLACLILPFVGTFPIWAGLGTFATLWRVNDGLFGVLVGFFTLLPFDLEPGPELLARGVASAGILTVVMLVTRWLAGQKHPAALGKACLGVLTALFFLAPTGNPWYFTWVLFFLPFYPMRSLILFSGLVFLYYLDFYFMYRGQAPLFVWVRLVEYTAFYGVFIGEVWKRKQQSLSFYPFSTNGTLLQPR